MSAVGDGLELVEFDRPGVFSDRATEGPSTCCAGSRVRAALRLTGYFSLVLVLLPVHLLLLPSRRAAGWVPLLFHRLSSRLLGLRISVRGIPVRGQPALLACNHISYLDVIALGAVLPCRFAAKSDVAGWPIFGWLARLQRTVFIERRVASTIRNRDAMRRALAGRDMVVLFPEGTSGDGTRVLPFKSSMFDIATRGDLDGQIKVQPATIAYTGLGGLPISRALRPLCAWYGDMELMPHLWTLLSLSSVEVIITFHPPVESARIGDRKALAGHCREIIASGLEGVRRA